MPIHSAASIKGGAAEENAAITRKVLKGEKGAHRDITLLNAGFAIHAGGAADSVDEGIRKAAESIDSGAAEEKLLHLAKVSQ